MEKKKKPRLRLQLFLPVLVILIIFPIAVFLMFSAVANGYFDQMAERNTDRLVIQMRRITRETYGDYGTSGRNDEPSNGKTRRKQSTDIRENNSDSRESEKFLSGVEEMMRSGNNKTSVLVLGSGLEISWPKEGELTEATSELLAIQNLGHRRRAISFSCWNHRRREIWQINMSSATRQFPTQRHFWVMSGSRCCFVRLYA